MALYKPSALREFLAQLGVSPKKSLSQNFLIDGNIIKKILSLAEIQKGDFVVEVGSGPGVLTEALLNEGTTVLAIEKDRRFAEALHRFQTVDQRLKVLEGDVLELPLAPLLKPPVKLVANLPYHITTPILTRLLPQRAYFKCLTVMVQKEVADRFLALPSSKAFGSLTLLQSLDSDLDDRIGW